MLTGYNSDVQHEGRVYHVQTEDKGDDNPLIETLIYVGGQILASRRKPYADLIDDDWTEDKLAVLLERQHQAIVRDVRLGKFDPPEERRPFGDGIVTDRSFDTVVRDFIEDEERGGTLPDPPRRKPS
ncbi:MAG: hypothetical protein ACE5IK_01390 [Acidobacteriota bacterium]